MKSICFYFQVHQPFRLKPYRFFDIGNDHYYFDDYQNRFIMRRVADKCYLPTNQLMLDLINEYGDAFKISYSISGTALDQFEYYAPEVLESFRKLAETGNVEFLSETYCHSLASLKSKEEFFEQVNMHRKRMKELIGVEPVTFRNTELIYSDGIGEMVSELGFNTMLTEGAKHILGWKSPNYLYCNAINPKLKLLLKNYRLSDDIAFRFSQQSWADWPLTTEKFVDWLNAVNENEQVINLFMDYETFGEHQWPETGIFDFLRALPKTVFENSQYSFNTPSELSEKLQPVSAIHVPHPISWADEERDLTAWLGNDLQDDAFDKVYSLQDKIKEVDNEQLKMIWRYLQTSDHFYYMCTKWFSDGDVHKYFNPYGTPYEAYINYMNVLSDFIARLEYASNDIIPVFAPDSGQNLYSEPDVSYSQESIQYKGIGELKSLSKSELKTLISSVDQETLILALKKAPKALKDHVKSAMTKSTLDKFEKHSRAIRHPENSVLDEAKDEVLHKMNLLFT